MSSTLNSGRIHNSFFEFLQRQLYFTFLAIGNTYTFVATLLTRCCLVLTLSSTFLYIFYLGENRFLFLLKLATDKIFLQCTCISTNLHETVCLRRLISLCARIFTKYNKFNLSSTCKCKCLSHATATR